MTGSAVHLCHSRYLGVFLLMANVTDRSRRFEAVQRNGVTLGTGDVLLLSVLLVTRGGCYLNPLGITAFMTFFTGIVRDYSMVFDSLVTPEGKVNQ